MGISLTPQQREAIRSVVLTDLSVIGDIPMAIDHGEYDVARRYRIECEQLTRLLDDLGWEDDHDGPVELTVAPDQLLPVITRLLDNQIAVASDAAAEWQAEAAESDATCRMLADLEAVLGAPRSLDG